MNYCYLIDTIGIYLIDDHTDAEWSYTVNLMLSMLCAGLEPPDTTNLPAYRLIIAPYHQRPSYIASSVIGEYASYNESVIDHQDIKTCIRMTDTTLEVWTDGQHGVVPFLLQQLLLLQHKTFVHAAGITLNNRGYLFPAFGGIGKTSLIHYAVTQAGATLLGDDLIILDRSGTLHPHTRPLCLYQYHRSLFSQYFAQHRFPYITRYRFIHRVVRRLARLCNMHPLIDRYVAPFGYTAIPAPALFSANSIQSTPIKLDSLVLLTRAHGITSPQHATDLTPDKAAAFMSTVLYHELSSNMPTLSLLLTATGSSFSDYFSTVERIMHDGIMAAQAPCTQIILPYSTPPEAVGPLVLEMLT